MSSWGISLVLTNIVKGLAWKIGAIDLPGERKVHGEPKPRLGGVAVYTTVLLVVGLNIAFFIFQLQKNIFMLPSWLLESYMFFLKVKEQLLAIFLSSALILAVGVWDDIKGLCPGVKFFFQFVAATIVVMSGIKISFLLPGLNEIVSVLWIVGITNSFNLLDNMDGLSGGIATIVFSSIFIISLRTSQFFVASISLVFMGAILGFLRYNFHPASIFLGDSGSLFLGFSLATISVVTSYYGPGMPGYWAILTPLFLMAPALFDTFSVMIIRYKSGKSFFVGDQNHLSHRLHRLGFSKRISVIILYVFTIICSISAVLLTVVDLFGAILIFFQVLLSFLLLSFFLYTKKISLET